MEYFNEPSNLFYLCLCVSRNMYIIITIIIINK